MKRYKLLILTFLWIFISTFGHAQNAPHTFAPNMVACANTIVHIPVTVSNFNKIGAISLTLDYDKNVLAFQGFTKHVNLPSSFTVDTLFGGRIRVGGYETVDTTGTSITDNEILFTMNFYYYGGSCNLTWIDSGISCEYSANSPVFLPLNDIPQSTYYFNGSVNPLPSSEVSSVTGTSPLCINHTATYTASGIVLGGGEGLWHSSDTLVAKVNPISGIVSTVGVGTCYIFFTINGCSGTVSQQQALTVYPNAVVNLVNGSSPLCINATANYSAIGVILGGGSGIWQSSDTLVAKVDPSSGLVTAVGPGLCNIIYLVTGCNGTASAFKTLMVNPDAVVGSVIGVTSLTINDISTFSVTGVVLGGGLGLWSSSDTLVARVNPLTGSVTAVSPGTCDIIFTVNGCNGNPSQKLTLVVNDYPIIIELQKGSNCAEFSVKLKPSINIQGNLTSIVFTVKWAATANADVQLTDVVSSWPGLTQLGSRISDGGYYYVKFSSLTSNAVNWLANSENTIMTFHNSGTGEGYSNFTIISSDYNVGTNTAYHVELALANATGDVVNQADDVSLNCGLYLKDILQGAYDSTLVVRQMRTDLKNLGYLPLVQPYGASAIAYAGSEMVTSFTAPVVDWIVIELRTGTGAATRVLRQAALLLSNGIIVGTDQSNAPIFYSLIPGNSYYVVIYHRNHLPVMTATAITFPNTAINRIDFTKSPLTNIYGGLKGVVPVDALNYGQISGDINMDNKLKFSGIDNDRGMIFSKINTVRYPLTSNVNSTITGYYAEDLSLNGVVKYSGPGNDQGIIYVNIDYFTTPTTFNTIFTGMVPYSLAKSSSESSNNGPVDISLMENNNSIDVLLQSQKSFSIGAFDNIQFTLKWKSLNNDSRSLVYSGQYGIVAQSDPIKVGEWFYQTFATVIWNEFTPEFFNNGKIAIMHIAKNSSLKLDELSIADNLESAMENSDFYVSILGENSTGKILSNSNIRGLIENDFSVYPNPISCNILHFNLPNSEDGNAEVKIFDGLSRLVKKCNATLCIDKNYSFAIDISELDKGCYIVVVSTSRNTEKFKLIRN